jgi:hypothetical protein
MFTFLLFYIVNMNHEIFNFKRFYSILNIYFSVLFLYYGQIFPINIIFLHLIFSITEFCFKVKDNSIIE